MFWPALGIVMGLGLCVGGGLLSLEHPDAAGRWPDMLTIAGLMLLIILLSGMLTAQQAY